MSSLLSRLETAIVDRLRGQLAGTLRVTAGLGMPGLAALQDANAPVYDVTLARLLALPNRVLGSVHQGYRIEWDVLVLIPSGPPPVPGTGPGYEAVARVIAALVPQPGGFAPDEDSNYMELVEVVLEAIFPAGRVYRVTVVHDHVGGS